MPQGEEFFNPYRWVPVSNDPIQRQTPNYHHRWVGLAGSLECELEALTPFLIGSANDSDNFIRKGMPARYFIPSTSLKGLIRSLAELIGNAAIPFPNGRSDEDHKLSKASSGDGTELDIAARMFGHLDGGRVFAGLVSFSDGELVDGQIVRPIGPFRVVVGQPQPDSHTAFYPDERRRKFYHHHPGSQWLVQAPANITQVRNRRPLPPGTKFRFTVQFNNLGQEELRLLLYCLVLEEQVTVTLSNAALAPVNEEPVTLTGPMRHKLGGSKPHGAGSVHIAVTRMTLLPSAGDRYRRSGAENETYEGDALGDQINRRTAAIRRRTDATMQHLRAMLIYSDADPRRPIHYPDFPWFRDAENGRKPLRPTL